MNNQEPEKRIYQTGRTEMPSIPIVEAAVSYAQNGWPVFPLHNKIPFKDSQGYKDATTDEQQIQKWWTLHPTANIGLATGEKSGVIVLDIDPPEGLWWPALSRHKKRVR